MKMLIVLAIMAGLLWHGYGRYGTTDDGEVAASSRVAAAAVPPSRATPATARFTCDGRTHCSQMRSCEEATYFLQHCPNTRMDGNNDGVPCEQQWCR